LRAESNGGVEEHGRKTQEDVTETLIRKRVEDLAKAVGAKDIDHVSGRGSLRRAQSDLELVR
jgi:hypothetical protein